MIEKYLIRIEQDGIAFKYNLAKRQAVIGGLGRLREDMEAIIEEYFKVPIPDPEFPTTRKISYHFRLSKAAFDAGMATMRGNGMIEKVKNHGRIMR